MPFYAPVVPNNPHNQLTQYMRKKGGFRHSQTDGRQNNKKLLCRRNEMETVSKVYYSACPRRRSHQQVCKAAFHVYKVSFFLPYGSALQVNLLFILFFYVLRRWDKRRRSEEFISTLIWYIWGCHSSVIYTKRAILEIPHLLGNYTINLHSLTEHVSATKMKRWFLTPAQPSFCSWRRPCSSRTCPAPESRKRAAVSCPETCSWSSELRESSAAIRMPLEYWTSSLWSATV